MKLVNDVKAKKEKEGSHQGNNQKPGAWKESTIKCFNCKQEDYIDSNCPGEQVMLSRKNLSNKVTGDAQW